MKPQLLKKYAIEHAVDTKVYGTAYTKRTGASWDGNHYRGEGIIINYGRWERDGLHFDKEHRFNIVVKPEDVADYYSKGEELVTIDY